MRIARLFFLACLFASPVLASDLYSINVGGHAWTITPILVIPGTYSIILAQDTRDAPKQRDAALAIAGKYAKSSLEPGCKVSRAVMLGQSGWRIDYACPKRPH